MTRKIEVSSWFRVVRCFAPPRGASSALIDPRTLTQAHRTSAPARTARVGPEAGLGSKRGGGCRTVR